MYGHYCYSVIVRPFIKAQTQQEISDVNCKLHRVDESVNEKPDAHMEKGLDVAKVESRINTNITSKLDEYRTEVELSERKC